MMLRDFVRASQASHRAQHPPSVVVHASFSFAESKRVKEPQQGRRNRAIEKRQEKELQNIVHGLCKMSGKQLQAVSHLLSEEQIKEIKVAMDIPPTNQGRRRQEALVVKLLRTEFDTLDLSKLLEAVTVSERNNLPFTDTDVEQQLQYWIDGLLTNDQDINHEVYQLLQQHGLDWQQLRTWVRQLQQHKQQLQTEPQLPAAALAGCQSSSSSSGSEADDSDSLHEAAVAALHVQDDEVRGLMLELAQQQQFKRRQRQGTAGGGQGQSSTSVTAARRSIRRLLKPLAVEVCM